jgi:hypothetical protein
VPSVGLVVEGQVDRVAGEVILKTRGLAVGQAIITGGKTTFDRRLAKYNQAARHGAWLAIRDSDRDGNDCLAVLRSTLLSTPQSPALCLRLAVRSLEAWLLADVEAVASHFAVSPAKVPVDVEDLADPKQALVNVCRSSRRRDVRTRMVPPKGASGPGPEYTVAVSAYCRQAWRPDVAGAVAPSLGRALREIDTLLTEGIW